MFMLRNEFVFLDSSLPMEYFLYRSGISQTRAGKKIYGSESE
jgi:hypothetical protein